MKISRKTLLALIPLTTVVSLVNIEPALAILKVKGLEKIEYQDLELGKTYEGHGTTPPASRKYESGEQYLHGLANYRYSSEYTINPLTIPTQCGCDTTIFKTQYKIKGAEFMGEMPVKLTISALPEVEFTFNDGSKATYDQNGKDNKSGVIRHEIKHIDHFKSFIAKIVDGLNEWAKAYDGAWFNSDVKAHNQLKTDSEQAFNKLKNDYFPKLEGWVTGSGHDEYDYNEDDFYAVESKPYFSLEDKGDWEKSVAKEIDDFKDYNNYPVSKQNDPKIPCVPGPLPILGVGIFFRFSRKIRRKLSQV